MHLDSIHLSYGSLDELSGCRKLFVQGLDLVFVAAYQQFLTVPYVDVLLQALREEFSQIYRPDVFDYPQFSETYNRILTKMEKQHMNTKMRTQGRTNGFTQCKVFSTMLMIHTASTYKVSHCVRMAAVWFSCHVA
jgi:hypothetical protein